MTRTWSEWIPHTAGKPCPIPDVKAGEFTVKFKTGSPFIPVIDAVNFWKPVITHYRYLLPETSAKSVTLNLVQSKICAEIVEIMAEYDEQAASADGIDCPSGLEHMGDVWRQLEDWRGRIIISQNSQHARQEDER